jgi:putative transposase
VGWLLAQQESGVLAQRLIRETCTKQGIEPGQLTLHADRGGPMTSKTLAQLLADLRVEKTHARPHVSDDNPFSESQFKTLKYWPGFPERFGSPEHAHDVSRAFISWYNHEHHHSGICFLTPAVVHYGRAELVLAERHQAQLAGYRQHPGRFVKGPPRPQRLPEAVWINPPDKTTHQDAPGSTQTDSDDPEVVPTCITYAPLTRSEALELPAQSGRVAL